MLNTVQKPANTVMRVASLAEHRALLKEVFDTARSRVVVVSPFISQNALDSDRITKQIASAVARGVSVHVYTDQKLNCEANGSFKPSAWHGISDMTFSGAKVKIVDGIHNKTLARDNDMIAEGSFNWLSAVRQTGIENQREERTMVVQGFQAKGMIEKEIESLEGKNYSVVSVKNNSNNIVKSKISGKKKHSFWWLWLLIILSGTLMIFTAGQFEAVGWALTLTGIFFELRIYIQAMTRSYSNAPPWPPNGGPDDGRPEIFKDMDAAITNCGYVGTMGPIEDHTDSNPFN